MIYEDKFKPEEIQAFKQVQKELKLSNRIIDYIVAYIGFESNFDYTCKHKISHIAYTTGFYYFTKKTLKSYHIASKALGSKSPIDQILFLIQYLSPFKHKLCEIENVVGALIDPTFVDGIKPETNVYMSKLQYRYFIPRGHLPFSEILSKVTDIYRQGKEDERLRDSRIN